MRISTTYFQERFGKEKRAEPKLTSITEFVKSAFAIKTSRYRGVEGSSYQL